MPPAVAAVSGGTELEAVLHARLAALPPTRIRRRRVVATPDLAHPVHVEVDGGRCLAFCSNDYLGLASHPEVVGALIGAARREGVGSGASHLITGHGPEHEALEAELAAFTGRARALVFSTGYMANLGIASALFMAGDRVFEDRLNHASLLDAGLGSGAQFIRYPHGDVAALARRLQRRSTAATEACNWVLTDGVFSMDGDVAPLAALAATTGEHAHLVVDDAHGFGVLGREGRGSVDAAMLGADDVPVLMATFGKALGTFGAFVAGSELLIETLVQKARTYIYTTALPAAVAAATRTSLRVAREENWRRERVLRHVECFRDQARAMGLPLLPSNTPIQPLLLGSEAAALDASAQLLSQGILVSAIRPPTVPEGSARLRITFSAAHEESDVERLLAALGQLRLEPMRS